MKKNGMKKTRSNESLNKKSRGLANSASVETGLDQKKKKKKGTATKLKKKKRPSKEGLDIDKVLACGLNSTQQTEEDNPLANAAWAITQLR